MIASLEARVDFSPVPRVEIRVQDAIEWDGGDPSTTGPDSFDGGTPGDDGAGFDAGSPFTVTVDVPDGTDSVTVWREADGRRMKVRGAVKSSYSGALGVQDLEAPFAVPSTYEVECFSGGTSIGTVPLGAVTLPPLDGPSWRTLIQRPLTPQVWAIVEDVDVHIPQIARPADAELARGLTQKYPSIVASGPRQGIVDADMVFAADTREIAARVWATLQGDDSGELPVWLIRSNHPLLPRVFFCDTRAPREASLDLHIGGEKSRFLVTVTEVAPPAPGLVVAALSYDDLDVSFASYPDRDAAFASYNDMDTAWDYAGAAG